MAAMDYLMPPPPSPTTYVTGGDIRINGQSLNYIDAAGCRWLVEELDGWWGLPTSVVPDSFVSIYEDGGNYVAGRYTPREIVLTGRVIPTETISGRQYVVQARSLLSYLINFRTRVNATNGQASWLEVDEYDATKSARVQLTARPLMLFDAPSNTLKFAVSLRASDPRKYQENTVLTTGLYKANAGRAYNKTFNYTYGASGNSGTVNVKNIGTTSSAPSFSIHGPVLNPRVEHLGNGSFIQVNGTLTSTDTLIIDGQSRTVTLNNSATNRRSMLSSDSGWITVDPGDNQIVFRGTPLNDPSTAQLTVYSASAWLE